jgi:alanyl-tRNA synthetase
VTVHVSDDEAQRLWESEIGLAPRASRAFDDDNFWTMGADRPVRSVQRDLLRHGPRLRVGPGDDGTEQGQPLRRVWNVVFQQYNRGADGVLAICREEHRYRAGFERMLALATARRRCTRRISSPT